MKKSFNAIILSAIFAALLTVSGCAQPVEPAPVLPDAPVVSQTEAAPEAEAAPAPAEPQTQPASTERCSGDHSFASDGNSRECSACGLELPSGYITDKETVIEAGGIILTIDPGAYVPGDLEENVEKLVNALETVSGLSFSDAKYNRNPVNVCVTKEIYENDNGISSESEMGPAWAVSGDSRELLISAGDLLLGNSYTIAHELSHTLNFSNSCKYFNQVAGEGFAEYNCYKAIQLLEQTDPEAAYVLDSSAAFAFNTEICDYPAVYSKSIEYWYENGLPYEYSGNGSYSLGFRFMAYLEDVYGDYSKWILLSDGMEGDDQNFPIEQQLEAFRLAYGKDVFDGFYPWLKENESLFEYDYTKPADYDLTGADAVTVYPFFMSFDCPTDLVNISSVVHYSDLYVDLEEAKNYLSSYKGLSLDDLALELEWVDGDRTIELFGADGCSIVTVTGEQTIPLDDVSFVLLKGEGSLGRFSVTGYKGYDNAE